MKYLFWGTVTANYVFLLLSSFLLPESVAMHFDMSGIPNQWGSRTEYLITMSILVSLLSTLFWGIRWFIRWIPVTSLNIPNKEIWLSENNRAEMYRRVDGIMAELGSVVLLFILIMVVFLFMIVNLLIIQQFIVV